MTNESPLPSSFVVGRSSLVALGALGLLAFAAALAVAPQRAWGNLLLGNFYFVSLALFGTVFVALTHLFSAGWAVLFRRVPESMSAYLPFGAAMMLALAFGLSTLYPWSRPEVVAAHPVLQHKAIYLNVPFFLIRMAAAFGVWILFSRLLRRHSRQQDLDGDLAHTRANQRHSAVFLILFAATWIFVSFDWVMSLEPEWSSTIFPMYLFAGLFLGGLAAMIALTIWLRERGQLPGVTPHHFYEMSRALCAAAGFWAFIGFSQYMLIYYANLPEEVAYYTRRFQSAGPLFALNFGMNAVLPLAMLLPVVSRRSPRRLLGVCVVVLAGRWLDLYLLIMPALGRPLHFGFPELLIFLGLFPLFLLPFLRSFQEAGPVPRQDPYLGESLHLHVLGDITE